MNKKRECYFSFKMMLLLGIYLLLDLESYSIRMNIFLRIILIIILFIAFIVICLLEKKLGMDYIDGEEIECKKDKINKFIENNYKLMTLKENKSFSIATYQKINNKKKSILIVIKSNKITYRIKDEISYSIDWYRDNYLIPKTPFIGKNYELKIICFCEDYDKNYLSDVSSELYLKRSYGKLEGIVIPIFISESREKMYVSGFNYILKYCLDYYLKEKDKLIKLLTENEIKT